MNLKVERAKRGITQTDLSRISGVSLPTIKKIEKGDIDNVIFISLKKISKVLDLPVSYLFFDEI